MRNGLPSQAIETEDFAEDVVTSEQRLYRGVIYQAFKDARAADNPRERRVHDEARRWFWEAGQDFKAVCSAAAVCPDKVRRNVLGVLGFQRDALA